MKMSEQDEQNKYLFALSAIDIPKAKDGQRRVFAGTAYAGGRVDGHWYWGRAGVVFDLDGIEIATPTPLLEEHFSANRIGVVKQVSTSGSIEVAGHFLKNKKALEIIQDSDDEFPFQMSMFIDPGSIEEVLQGQTVNVNGQSFTGPIAVFRNNRIREFTICSTGADRNTSIKAFSGKPNLIQQEDTSVDLEQAKARIVEQDAEIADLKKEMQEFKANKRNEDIAALAKDAGKEFSADEVKEMQDLDEKSFAFSAAQIRKFASKPEPQKPTLPSYLTQHQAVGDGQNQFNAGQPKSLADMAAERK